MSEDKKPYGIYCTGCNIRIRDARFSDLFYGKFRYKCPNNCNKELIIKQ